jgi:hypothetical protein
MSPTHTEIAEAFSRHTFADTYRYMLDDIEWTLIGHNTPSGKGRRRRQMRGIHQRAGGGDDHVQQVQGRSDG